MPVRDPLRKTDRQTVRGKRFYNKDKKKAFLLQSLIHF